MYIYIRESLAMYTFSTPFDVYFDSIESDVTINLHTQINN